MNPSWLHPHLSTLSTAKTLWIAYSGGLDSHVLLHSLQDYPATTLRAIHVHHGLNPKADAWAAHCQTTCDALNIPLHIEKIHLPAPHRNIEASAREKRYAVFSGLLNEGEALLTAHHQEDQAETLLLQLFRGAGLKGLSAMPETTSFAKGMLIRPLLQVSQSELQQYARNHQLQWVEDESNHHLHLRRNFLRHQILPLLNSQWPSLAKTLSRSARHLAEAQTLLDTLAEQDLAPCLTPDQTLWVPPLLALPPERQKNAIRYWIQQRGLALPSDRVLGTLQKTVLTCKPDAMPLVTWTGGEVRRYRQYLHATPAKSPQIEPRTYEWDIRETLVLENGQILTSADLIAQKVEVSNIQSVTVRFRQGGERCRKKGEHSKLLKKLFQERGIPPWERKGSALIYQEDTLIAILPSKNGQEKKPA